MIMQKIKLFTLAALTGGLILGTIPQAGAAEDEVNYQPFTLGAEVGTLGLGGAVSWRFSDHFGARSGVNFFFYNHTDDIEGNDYDADLQLLSFPLAIDYFPSKSSAFRVTLGVLLNLNELDGSTPLGQPVELNGNNYADAGLSLNLHSEQELMSPFIAIGGNIHFGKAKNWSLGYELGVAYTGSPDVSLTRTGAPNPGLDADLAAERQQLEDKAEDYKFYPIVKVSVNFSF